MIHTFNCFTCNARVPKQWHTGTMCLLIETKQGLVLVDTGLGQGDYLHKSSILRVFQVVTIVPLNPEEAAVLRIRRLGYKPEDVRHIVLTHMHFDHAGGLPDFPHATVHVHRREHDAFTGSGGRMRRWTDLAYVRRHIAHGPQFSLYEEDGETWYDFPAVRLPFEPEMWLVPLHGHSYGHCGVAVQTDEGWLFHVGDAAPVGLGDYAPKWLVRLVLGPWAPRLRAFRDAHPEIRFTTGHEWLDFWEEEE